jgi:hypothetical protein
MQLDPVRSTAALAMALVEEPDTVMVAALVSVCNEVVG